MTEKKTKTIEERLAALENISPNESKLMQKVNQQRIAIKELESRHTNNVAAIRNLEKALKVAEQKLVERTSLNDLAVEAEETVKKLRNDLTLVKQIVDRCLGAKK